MTYSPLRGVNQRYPVGMGKSVWCPNPAMRFVGVPKPLVTKKIGLLTQIVLRKHKDTIEVADLR